ncbi:MAG: hypothetical protein JOZ72_19100 [Alphaproteobacteria bacterium]|nr:hypothetical protein [Alphaproteobacteria bacterium]
MRPTAATAAILALISSAGMAHATLVISDGATSNANCSHGTCTATAAHAVLNVHHVANMLATGDVSIKTASGAGDIAVTRSLSWGSKGHLSLQADNGVGIGAPVVVAGKGGIAIATGAGALSFSPRGKIQFADTRGTLSINGDAYVLADSIQSLASAFVFNTTRKVALARDYDATPDGVYSFSPIREIDTELEGLGNTISNFQVAEHGTTAIFVNVGLVEQSLGTIRDLHMIKSSAVGGSDDFSASLNVGLMVGINDGTILHSDAKGYVSQFTSGRIGGLVGQNSGHIMESQASARVYGGDVMGGLVGINLQGTISNSHAGGTVQASPDRPSAQGGLVGRNEAQSTITLSYSTATVRGTTGIGGVVGGLLGLADSGTVSLCFAQGPVSGRAVVGGLIGLNVGQLSNSYSLSPINGKKHATMGGIAGEGSSFSNISNVYAAGAFTVEHRRHVGGIMGFLFDGQGETFAKAYWDLDATTVTDPADGVGNVANQPGTTGLGHAAITSALPAGFDPAIWARDDAINGGYPYLIANPPPPPE